MNAVIKVLRIYRSPNETVLLTHEESNVGERNVSNIDFEDIQLQQYNTFANISRALMALTLKGLFNLEVVWKQVTAVARTLVRRHSSLSILIANTVPANGNIGSLFDYSRQHYFSSTCDNTCDFSLI